ncbi:synaptosomal-associated protein 29 [Helicoverpa armigera]|uniref:synaptosomal-associated protein 29 n=1 Tax=Helicoverpa armigera TaxID=29058 RepID=UPI0021116406|nr:synaptosomal-associated protein 29 [Helicoverpa armigera]
MSRPGATYVNPNKLFEDDDENDVDDETFVNSFRSRIPPPQPSKPAPSAYGSHIAALEQQRQAMLERQREIEQRTLDSSSRSIGLLRESEQIGIATAEELSRQREQLQNTNKRLDEINTNLNYSQKHLNGIKSVFYGLKNYISGKSDQTPPRSQPSPSTRSAGPSSRLNDTLDNLTQVNGEDRFRSHPATRLRELDAQVAAPITDSQRVNQVLDANLDEMVHAISRLKGLGIALGEEIEQQSDLIDTIHDKVEEADIKMGKQNKQMNKILGK